MEEQYENGAKHALLNFLNLKIEFDYNYLLQKFLECNILSNERDFIELEIDRVAELIRSSGKEADFFFMDAIETDEEYEGIKARDHYWYYKLLLEFLNEKLNKPATKIKRTVGELSAAEIAIRHWYLVEARQESYIIPKHVGEKYSHLADPDNVAKTYSKLDKKTFAWKASNINQLLNVRNTLDDHPNIKKAIDNHIDRLK